MEGAFAHRAAPASGVRPEIEALPDSQIAEVARYGRGRPGLIPLWFGESDVATPPFICEAADRAMRDGHVFYTDQRGIPALREAIAQYLAPLHGVGVDVERINVVSSGMTGIMLAMQCLVGPGDEVAIVSPVWPNVFAAVGIVGGTARPVPLVLGAAGWSLDLDLLFASCGPRTRAIFLNAPGNPTGWMMPRADMERVLAFARERGLWIISDEVYARLVYDAPVAPSFLDIAEADDRVLIINSFSKAWAMTGWRLGWVVAPPSWGPIFEKMVQFNNSGTPGFIQVAGVTAIEEGEGFVAEQLARSREGRDIVCDALGRLSGIQLHRPEAAFYAFFSIAGVTDSLALAKRLVDEAGVGLAPGTAFGAGGEGYLRLCFASRPERLRDAMERLTRVLG